jgi:hypothetical protein
MSTSTITTVYTIAKSRTECYGHGDFGTEKKVCRMGAWGEGDYPPVFMTEKAARNWLDKQDAIGRNSASIIPLILIHE